MTGRRSMRRRERKDRGPMQVGCCGCVLVMIIRAMLTVAVLGSGDKPRLSRAARRLLKKKRRVSGGDAPGLTQPHPQQQQPKPKGKALRDFREPGAYIDYGVTEYEKLVEDQLQPRSIVKDREMLVANR